MAFIILNNTFSDDSRSMRSARLFLLSANIGNYAQGLSLEAAVLAWAEGAYTAWDAARSNQTAETGEKLEAFQTFDEEFNEMHERYVFIKEMLLSRYPYKDEAVEVYAIGERIPNDNQQQIDLARQLIHGHEVQKAKGDPNILPDAVLDAFQALIDSTQSALDIKLEELSQQKAFTKAVNKLYDEDSYKLRMLYNWICSFWGRYDERFYELGFVPAKKRHGGQPDAPTNLACDTETKTFSWDETHLATSYQLAYREYIKPDPDKKVAALDWEEAYQGADTSVVFDPGIGDFEFKVRARNKHGFGDFSEVIVVNFSGGALAAPVNFKFDDVKQLFFWDTVVGADRYQLEYSRDGGGTWSIKYNGADTKFDASDMDSGKWLFRVRALNATETSPWGITLEVWLGVPAIPGNLRWHPAEHIGVLMALLEWDIAAGATEYELSFSDNGGDIIDVGADLFKYEDIMGTPRTYRYKVRGKNGFGVSDWSETLTIWVGVPAIPLNLRWHPEEHNGHLEAKIEWDIAAGADSYEVMATHNGGDIIYQGPDTYIYEDILGTPRTYTYKVCGKNGFGVSDWSETLVIVIE